MMAITADGIIGRNAKQRSTDWTSQADKKAFVAESKKHGAIIMGETTYATIGRPLPGRLNLILTRTPEKFKSQEIPGTLEYTQGTPQEIIAVLAARGFESAVLGGGARTNSLFLKAGVVDELILTVEPKIFGVGLRFTENEILDLDLELIELQQLDKNVVQLHYRIKRYYAG